MTWLSLSAACLLSAAPLWGAAAAEKRFPIGLYGVDEKSPIPAIAEAGFNAVQSYVSDPERLSALAREARRRGVGLLAVPDSLLSAPAPRRWPVEAWVLADEPDVSRVEPQAMEEKGRRVGAWDPRPRALVVGEGRQVRRYGNAADVMMLDWYPVPHLPLDSVADQLDAAEVRPEGKPLWMVLQAFDWRDFPQKNPKQRVGRFPDHAEIRFMSYLSILHGARGLFYFTFQKPGGKTLLDYPEEWQALARVVRELSSLRPILEGGRRSHLPFPPNPDGVEAAAWRYRLRDYVIVLNRKRSVMQRVPEVLLEPEWRPLFETRRDPRELLKKVGKAWYLPPYRVLVLESRLRWPWSRRQARPELGAP